MNKASIIKEKIAQGLSNPEIARATGFDVDYVRTVRRRTKDGGWTEADKRYQKRYHKRQQLKAAKAKVIRLTRELEALEGGA